VALQLPGYYLLFGDEGVSQYSLEAEPHHLPEGTWALANSDHETTKPCLAFFHASRQRRAWIINTTSPMNTGWKSWKKYYMADMFIMKHFSIQEIAALGLVCVMSWQGCSPDLGYVDFRMTKH
jgi:hypothetical protein